MLKSVPSETGFGGLRNWDWSGLCLFPSRKMTGREQRGGGILSYSRGAEWPASRHRIASVFATWERIAEDFRSENAHRQDFCIASHRHFRVYHAPPLTSHRCPLRALWPTQVGGIQSRFWAGFYGMFSSPLSFPPPFVLLGPQEGAIHFAC